MKNSTTAFILFIICMMDYFWKLEVHVFLMACIFASTYLITKTLEKNGK